MPATTCITDMNSSSSLTKPKVVVVMGATGAGKSRLAIDLATSGYSFPCNIEVVNADSMQVYRGLDVLTNKVSLHEQKGVPHHLLGVVDTAAEFTSRDFRDLAVPIINDILSRGCLPIIVGGTNYYIQALVSPFLIDDLVDDECFVSDSREEKPQKFQAGKNDGNLAGEYDHLKELDPVAAVRIHPNDHRKVRRYLDLYASTGVLPSELLQEKTSSNWGQPCNFRYDCCFVWVDVSLPILDRFVEERVDSMVEDGLLKEVFKIYGPNSDYTRGLRQAIGVREFEDLFSTYFSDIEIGKPYLENFESNNASDVNITHSSNKIDSLFEGQFIGGLTSVEKYDFLINEAIRKMKQNTCRLVRRQRRRLNRLRTLFGWNLHYFDATDAYQDKSEERWLRDVVEPCLEIVKAFVSAEGGFVSSVKPSNIVDENLASRNLWTQYKCEACGDRILRGTHEWEQHRLGRGHRKRVAKVKKNCNYLDDSSVTSGTLNVSSSAASKT